MNLNLDSITKRQRDNTILELNDTDYVSDNEIKKALSLVDRLDFSKINNKLVNYYGWNEETVKIANGLYKKWLALHICYPDLAMAPSELIDEYWHMHILDTRKYMEDCQLLFGYYLHHYPYFGLEGDKENLNKGFELTRRLFKYHFGHDLIGKAHPCSSKSCR